MRNTNPYEAVNQMSRLPATRRRTSPAVFVLLVLHVILGLGAIGGGVMLIADPSGEKMGMPLSVLERTFFSSYLIPGILLLLIFGVFPLLVAYALRRQPDWRIAEAVNPYSDELHPAWALSLYVGFGQIIWITVQTYMMNAVAAVHLGYMALGLLILIVTLLPSVRSYCLKK